jgi:hypothetical protein
MVDVLGQHRSQLPASHDQHPVQQHNRHLQPFAQHRVHGEEVHRQHTLGLGPEELPPPERRPDRCRVDTAALQDGPDGAGPKPGPEPAQLTVDAAVPPSSGSPWPAAAPDRGSLPPRLDDHAGVGRSNGAGPGRGAIPAAWPAAPTVPAHPAGQQPRQPSQHRPVSPVQSGSGHPPAQHANLVAQQQELGILGCRTSRQQPKPPISLQNIRYISRRVIHRSSRPGDCPGELPAQHPRPTFWHPQGQGQRPGRGRGDQAAGTGPHHMSRPHPRLRQVRPHQRQRPLRAEPPHP